MIGLDTDVVVRYLVQDDPDQAAVASALSSSDPDNGLTRDAAPVAVVRQSPATDSGSDN